MTELYVPAPDPANSTSIPTTATVDVRPVDAAHGVIITVSGPLMSDGVDLVQEHLGAELDRRRQVIVLDLSAVPSCDPAGVDVLARARDRARHEGLSLTSCIWALLPPEPGWLPPASPDPEAFSTTWASWRNGRARWVGLRRRRRVEVNWLPASYW